MRRTLGWLLLGTSLLLQLFTVGCFAWLPDHFAAFTVLPIWLWGGGGLVLALIGYHLLRGGWPWLMIGLWAVTLLIGADEAQVLRHFGATAPQRGPATPYQGHPVIRVITMNCAIFALGNPAKDLAVWNPDIVLLQDAFPEQVRQISEALYGSRGSSCTHLTNGIVTRWQIQRAITHPTPRDQQATIILPDGSAVEVVNVHLVSAATDLQFWKRTAWREHRINRALRLAELAIVQQLLAQTTDIPNTPILFGGDFNSSATDLVHHRLSGGLVDAFAAVGTGWGDTYHRRFPILRIDRLYASRHLTPVRCHTAVSRHSDHRMLVADFIRR